MSRITDLANWLLRLPLLWGTLATLLFYVTLQSGWVSVPVVDVDRYFNSHPVERVATLLFFVAVASLVIRLTGVAGQFVAGRADPLGEPPVGGVPPTDASAMLAKLAKLPTSMQQTWLVGRLRAALSYVKDTGSADSLEEQLERLELADRERVSAGYALPRLIRAVLPIVGMLGTVIGITLAIGQLSPDQLEESLTEVMAALSVAFDTTAQAMSLMLLLWFAMFGVERAEERLLQDVDRAVSRQLIGRFHQYGSQTDPSVAAVRRMSEQVVSSVDQLVSQQAATWQTAIDATHERWSDATRSAGELLTTTLANGLREGLSDHAQGLNSGVEQQLAELSDRLTEQQERVGETLGGQLEGLERIHLAHTERLARAGEEQTTRLVAGADGLLGNLRAGLERMAELLVEALQQHGQKLTAAEEELAAENRRHLGEVEAALGEAMVVSADRQEKLIRQSEKVLREMQQALVGAAGATIDHQNQLVQQGEVLLKVVESTNQVQRLEETLNHNLATLGRGHNFEETLMSLSAAIQLLSARVGAETPTLVTPDRPQQAA